MKLQHDGTCFSVSVLNFAPDMFIQVLFMLGIVDLILLSVAMNIG